ncbi:Adaptive-response sensory-kinase SasA [Sporomusa acidovorans DSM 3132]|uniref:histidine kinase n=2 Tax=Sporomusa TaxID=2375 RepID=A0ABZ3J346_SPOA4|nr:sporulation kinase A [Sporomusa acidovorans DSM 3132]SDD46803.1 PAS domain S-box-containing protein [Sporomusa acidovorans]
MLLIYTYLYVVYRERYFGFWIVSCLLLFLRNILFDSGIFDWTQSIGWFSCFQVITFAFLLIFIKGTYLFAGKPLNRRWLYAAAGLFLLGCMFTIMHLPLVYRFLPCTIFGGIAGIWLGISFIRYAQLNTISRLLLGYGFIFWGVHSLDMPFLIDETWFLPWGYLIESFLRLFVAIATLLVYFEKTRLALIDKEALYRLLAENAVDSIYRYRLLPIPKFEYVSPSIYACTGYTPEEFYADANLLFKLTYPEDFTIFCQFINNPARLDHLPQSFRLTRKDKNTIWVEQTCVPIYDNDGKLLALEGIIRDITSRKSLEQIALRADRLNTVGEMAASVAHEIRNPMTTVRGYLQLLLNKREFSLYRDRFELMIQELDRTNSIIREYLCMAKEKRSDLKKCSLNRIIKSLLPLIQAEAIASAADVTHDLAEIPELQLDENEIRQLLLNLVRNGLEAMPTGGSLNICTFMEKDKVILAVNDKGHGIPDYILNNLGKPFLTTKDTGTGLGLPMCYRIAQRHQADIQVKTSNQGTTFFIRFSIA